MAKKNKRNRRVIIKMPIDMPIMPNIQIVKVPIRGTKVYVPS
jgi:hypothetical protein